MAKHSSALRHGLMLFLALAASTGSGCGARSGRPPVDLKRAEYPAWLVAGSGCQSHEGLRGFFGVGSVAGIRNMALARTTSDNRARAEAAKVFEHFVTTLVKGYVESANAEATGSDGLEDAGLMAIDDVHIEQAIKSIMAICLNGIQITEHWVHPVDGSVFALARLDLRYVSEDLNRIKELPEPVREFARRNADNIHAACAHEKSGSHGADAAPAAASPAGQARPAP